MSLRVKLPFFTAIFVLAASITILSISIHQTIERRNKDIHRAIMLGKENPAAENLFSMRVDEIKESTKEIIRDRIIFSALLLVICVVVIFLFSRNITGPILRLDALAEEITAGRKSYSERITITTKDEIGRLAHSFNTLLQHMENTLANVKENAEKYRELIENANSAIVRIDKQGKVLFFNEYAQKLFGYPLEEVVEKTLDETIGNSVGTATESAFESLKNNRYIELLHRDKNGIYITIGWTNRPVLDKEAGVPKEYLCVGSDITEKKKAEKYAELQQRKLLQTDKMTTLGILAAGIAHEINNPNNFIILNSQNFHELWKEIKPVLDRYAELEKDYAISGVPYVQMKQDLPVLIQGITDGARRIKHIVDTLKDFARQDSGDLGEVVDIRKVIEAAQLITGNLIKKATERFVVEIKGEIPAVRGNFQRLEQVLINLISNACQANASPDKPIVITARHVPASHKVSIVVVDRGTGISPESMKFIFNPFFTTKRETGGTGLGLAIAFSIVQDHGGELKIESKAGKGTTATVLLPVG